MDKSLKKLSRVELLELMVQLSDECENLARENGRLKQKLAQRHLPRNAKVGSIAEAALQANGYFEAAQRSADEYLREIKYLRDELALRSNRSPEEAREILANEQERSRAQKRMIAQAQADAQAQAQSILKNAQARANQIVSRAQSQARAIIQEARARAGSRQVQPIAPLDNTQQAPSASRQHAARSGQRSQAQQGQPARQGAQQRHAQSMQQSSPAPQRTRQPAHQRTGRGSAQAQAQGRPVRRPRQGADAGASMPRQNLRPRPSASGR